MQPSPRRAGFTLIELLVVISIIALLIGILLPALSSARQAANAATCLSRLRNIGQGLYLYANDYDNSLPPGSDQTSTNWALLLYNTMGASGTTFATQNRDDFLNQAFRDVDTLPTESTSGHRIHYSAHPRLMPDITTNENWPLPSTQKRRPVNLDVIKNASELIAVFDGVQVAASENGVLPVGLGLDSDRLFYDTFLVAGVSGAPGDRARAGLNLDAATASLTSPSTAGEIRYRHQDDSQGNMLYVDGHAGGLKYDGNDNTELYRKNVNVQF